MNEAEILLTDVFNCDLASLYLNKDLILDKEKSEVVVAALKRRINCEPLQYILGKTEFMGLEFKVTPDVLIPRPETEILVEVALSAGRVLRNDVTPCLLEIGTGSGCIAISLAKLLPGINVIAVDISEKALEVAKVNARLNNVSDRINFIQSDLFSACGLKPSSYDLIVSNPPYIASNQINRLQPEIKYEPRIALDGGRDGLDFYRKIIKAAPRYLKEGGFLIMEMGFNQKSAIEDIVRETKDLDLIEIIKDYNNIDRIIILQRRI